MTVYIDVLFILNLIINYFILLATASLLHLQEKRLRICAGAAVGALYACLMFFPSLSLLYNFAAKLLVSFLIVLLSFRLRGIRLFLKQLLAFYAISMLFGGVIYAFRLFLAPPLLSVRNGIAYMDISPIFLILTSAACYFLIALFSRFFHRDVHTKDLYVVELEVEGKKTEMTALLDNGNALFEPMTGIPVVVAEYAKVQKCLPSILRDAFKSGAVPEPAVLAASGYEKRFRVVPYGSVGSVGGLLPAFRPDVLTVRKTTVRTSEVLVAVTGRRLSENAQFSMLLNPRLFRGEQDQHKKAVTEKETQ